VAAIVLPPGKFATNQLIDGRHRLGQIVSRRAEILLA
jgi:hypothetical protein